MHPIQNIAFGGCGVRNAAYAGALLALESRGLYQEVHAVSGSSAGSIVAAMAAVRYSPDEIHEHIMNLDFSRITSENIFSGAWNLAESFGWHDADYLEEALDEIIARKLGRKGASFQDLKAISGMDLRITGTNLSRRSFRLFPDARSDDLSIARAVRISVAIPLFFEAITYQDELYVDGGILWNLPIEAFDSADQINPATLGLLVKEPSDHSPMEIKSAHSYFEALFRTILHGQEADLGFRPTARHRVVQINDLGISAVNFKITREQKSALVAEGRKTTLAFLDQRIEST